MKVEVVVGVEVGVEEEIGTGREEVDIRVEVKVRRIAWKQNEDQSKPNDSTGLDMIPQILVAAIEGGQEGNNRIPNFRNKGIVLKWIHSKDPVFIYSL